MRFIRDQSGQRIPAKWVTVQKTLSIKKPGKSFFLKGRQEIRLITLKESNHDAVLSLYSDICYDPYDDKLPQHKATCEDEENEEAEYQELLLTSVVWYLYSRLIIWLGLESITRSLVYRMTITVLSTVYVVKVFFCGKKYVF